MTFSSKLKYLMNGEAVFVLNMHKEPTHQNKVFGQLENVFPHAETVLLKDYLKEHERYPAPAFLFYPSEELKQIMDALNEKGGYTAREKLIVIDHSWFGGSSRGKYFRFTVGATVPFVPESVKVADFKQLKKFGVKKTSFATFKKYSEERKHVLILPPDPKAELFLGVNSAKWVEWVTQKILCENPHVCANDLIIRDRYTKDRTLVEDFDRSFACIAYNSVAGVEAMLYGLPVIGTPFSPYTPHKVTDVNLCGFNGISLNPEFLEENHGGDLYQSAALTALTRYMLPANALNNRKAVLKMLDFQFAGEGYWKNG